MKLKRAKGRRAKVILAQLNRELGITSITSRILKQAMNYEIIQKFGIHALIALPEDKMKECLELVLTFRFHYMGRYFG